MKILIEGYQYQEADVKHILQGFEPYTKNGITKIDYVGYFFSKEIGDCIFFLPKVLMNERNEILFHEDLTPEKILDLDVALKNEWIKKDDYDFLSQFSVWIFRAIKEFYRLNPKSENLLSKSFSLIDRNEDEKDATLLDIILSLIRFNNENQDFFMFTIKNIHSGYNKINWNKTISQSAAVMQHKTPIYLDLVNKKKQINFDEELLIIFFSILAHVNGKYGFRTPINYNYELISEAMFENYLAGYGLIRLRQIKYKYFSDKALQLWNLCYTFFEAAEKINSSEQDCDYLIARNFNIVFESIIDELIGDDKTKIDASLKDQPDGKIVDHIFRYSSLINESDISAIASIIKSVARSVATRFISNIPTQRTLFNSTLIGSMKISRRIAQAMTDVLRFTTATNSPRAITSLLTSLSVQKLGIASLMLMMLLSLVITKKTGTKFSNLRTAFSTAIRFGYHTMI